MNNTNSMDATKRAGARMAGDLEAMITDGKELLKAAASVSDETLTAAREGLEQKVAGARTALTDASQQVVAGTRRAAAATDEFVHGNAWTVVGIAAVAGALIGFLATRR